MSRNTFQLACWTLMWILVGVAIGAGLTEALK